MDYYHHYYVNAPRSGEHHTGDIVKYFLDNRNDKISKDIKANKDGEKYFEVSDLEEGVLTFRQFINYITKTTSETLQGKVRNKATQFYSPTIEDFHYRH